MSFSETTMRRRPLRATTTLATTTVLSAAVALGLFVGPTSIRRVFHVWVRGAHSELVPLVAERVLLVAVLGMLLRVSSQGLARGFVRRGLVPAGLASDAAALSFLPFMLLLLAFVPGLWGDRSAEPFSFAMLFLFVSTALTCLGLQFGPALAQAARKHASATLRHYGLVAFGVFLVIGWLRPYEIQPHWTIPDDESPFWPTGAYLLTYALSFAILAAPVLAVPAALLQGGRRLAAWSVVPLVSVLTVGSGMAGVTASKRAHDQYRMTLLYPPEATARIEYDGRKHDARVLEANGLAWDLPDGITELRVRLGVPILGSTWAQPRDRRSYRIAVLGQHAREISSTELRLVTGPAGDAPKPAEARLRLPAGNSPLNLVVRPVEGLPAPPVLVSIEPKFE